MSRRMITVCDVCQRELREGVPSVRLAVSMDEADVCSVECGQLWITRKLEEPQMPLPLCYDVFGGPKG
jgi:hypothetical protein